MSSSSAAVLASTWSRRGGIRQGKPHAITCLFLSRARVLVPYLRRARQPEVEKILLVIIYQWNPNFVFEQLFLHKLQPLMHPSGEDYRKFHEHHMMTNSNQAFHNFNTFKLPFPYFRIAKRIGTQLNMLEIKQQNG